MLPYILVFVFLLVVGAAYYYNVMQTKSSKSTGTAKSSKDSDENKKASVIATPDGKTVRISMDDLVVIFARLKPTSQHWDILFAVVASGELVSVVSQALDEIEEIRQKKLKKKQEEEAKKKNDVVSFDDLFDQDGFDEGDEDEDDDEATKEAKRKAKEEEERKKADMERLRQATGQKLPLLEDMDEGVLGQKWVEKTLQEKGFWPLELPDWLKKAKFDWKGKKMSAMEHPAMRRILCMTAGRINAAMLNGHPKLVEAGQKKMLDQTYFRASMDFRQRIVITLETCSRIATALQSYRLFGTMVQTQAIFKIGCQPDALPWFNGIMARQYSTLPRIAVGTKTLESEDESNKTKLVAGGHGVFSLAVERTHTEQFVKVKAMQAQKQGLPPEVIFQTSRETWWFLLRCERLDGPTPAGDPVKIEESPILQAMPPKTLKAYTDEAEDYKLRCVWPMMVKDIRQKAGTIKIRVKLPLEPGKYRYTCAIKSPEFLGADQEVTVDATIEDGPLPENSTEIKKDQ